MDGNMCARKRLKAKQAIRWNRSERLEVYMGRNFVVRGERRSQRRRVGADTELGTSLGIVATHSLRYV